MYECMHARDHMSSLIIKKIPTKNCKSLHQDLTEYYIILYKVSFKIFLQNGV